MNEDLKECKVYCINCNAYLYSVSIYEPISQRQNTISIKCPHPEKCEDEELEMYRIPFYH